MSFLDNITTAITGQALTTTASTTADLTAAVATGVEDTLANGIATLGVPETISGAIGGAVGRVGAGLLDEQIGKGLTKLINEVGGPDPLLNRAEQLLVGEAASLLANPLNNVIRGSVGKASSLLSSSDALTNAFTNLKNTNPVEAAMATVTGLKSGGNIKNIMKDSSAQVSGLQNMARSLGGDLLADGALPPEIAGEIVAGLKEGGGDFSVDTFKNIAKDGISSLTSKLPLSPGKLSIGEQITNKANEATGTNILIYPTDLNQNPDALFMVLEIDQYSRPEFSTELIPSTKIALPLPEALIEAYGVKLDQADINEYGDVLSNPRLQGAVRNANDAKDKYLAGVGSAQQFQLGRFLKDMGVAAADGQGNAFDMALAVAGGAGSVMGRKTYNTFQSAAPELTGILESSLGGIPNPHPSVFFKGMNLRTHTLQWKFAPKSEEDSKAMKAVMKKMKDKFLPKKTGGDSISFLKYPHIVKPVIQNNDVRDFLFEYKRCMVSGINISYTPDGSSAFYRNGSPVAVIINLELQEIELAVESEQDS